MPLGAGGLPRGRVPTPMISDGARRLPGSGIVRSALGAGRLFRHNAVPGTSASTFPSRGEEAKATGPLSCTEGEMRRSSRINSSGGRAVPGIVRSVDPRVTVIAIACGAIAEPPRCHLWAHTGVGRLKACRSHGLSTVRVDLATRSRPDSHNRRARVGARGLIHRPSAPPPVRRRPSVAHRHDRAVKAGMRGGHADGRRRPASGRLRIPMIGGGARRLPGIGIERSALGAGRLYRHNAVPGTSASAFPSRGSR